MGGMKDEEVFKDWFPDDRKAWERMPGEPPKAYKAFQCYLEIEPSHERTIPLALSTFYDKPLDHYRRNGGGHVIPPHVMDWKKEWMWDARAAAYDFQNARDRMQAIRDARIEKSREEGITLADTEHMNYHLMQEQYNKLVEAIPNLNVNNPTWRELQGMMKVMSELMVNFYKINKFKDDMKDDTGDGFSDADMDAFWAKTPPNQQVLEETSRWSENGTGDGSGDAG